MPEPTPASPHRLHTTLLQIVDVLDALALPYMIVGALAVGVWGRPRGTADVDVTVRTDAAGLDVLAAHVRGAGFDIDDQWLDWNPLLRGSHLRLLNTGVIVDLMRPRDQHEDGALERRQAVPLAGRALWLVAPDDLILMKLKAGRPRDFEDASVVLTAQRGSLDETYLSDWARRIGVMDELSYLLGAAGG